MVQQCLSYVGVVEKLKVYDIVLGLGVFEIGCYERLQACVYKGVETGEKGEQKCREFFCVREKKSLETLN